MSGRDWLRYLIRGGAAPARSPLLQPPPALGGARAAGVVAPPPLRALAGGRLSRDKVDQGLAPGFLTLIAPEEPEQTWRLAELDMRTLDKVSPARLIQLLADLSPDVSRALWDFLRLCNPGWEVRVLRPGTEEADARGEAVVTAFLDLLDDLYGSVDVTLGRLFAGPFLRGAFLSELVLDPSGREGVDLATPDPASARFVRVQHPTRGRVWQLGQWQAGQFVALDRPTVRYLPIDPFPDSPYGRPLASPAIFTSLFLLMLLHDLRRVIAQQGYPRHDLQINLERLLTAMPAAVRADPQQQKVWVEAVLNEIKTVYSGLEPDDAYVHTDVVTVNRPVGTVDSRSLGAVDGLIQALERMAVRALKTMPLLMGITDGVSEANANRQWEIHVQGIKSIQHYAETLLERLLGLLLEAQGIQATVEFRFAENRAAELLRDAQVEQLQIDNAARKRDEGWLTQEEASLEVTGQPPALDAPLRQAESTADAAAVEADPGSNRSNGHRDQLAALGRE